ncbi:mycofactocin system transcriptional regulator [Thalassovita autumnalis]|uniref:Mycofactocin system transcriptional regulator n=1 Tax=Thalassovita autumnalis TaxID=2072972 RepID=A0A0P1FZG5_9RHOB|nr:TetR/AcrR family transcriptional regulator [Thalassovita autumnalis]CUH64268.1 mycofactocin system transcriptional regulator [Thalassovita autumnalis]CUH74425.1 mycofactocin system transcriptional regulator [Thalassovita autumnalis]
MSDTPNQTAQKIAAGLEQAFAKHGFAEPNVEVLRDAAGVSLRTLYKYMPSRSDMVLAALEHRHQRYLNHMFSALPGGAGDAATGPAVFAELLRRVGQWMVEEASHGCLFHAAVAAAPTDQALQSLLQRHKAEVAGKAASAVGLPDQSAALLMIFEGVTQCWPLQGQATLRTAQALGRGLFAAELA